MLVEELIKRLEELKKRAGGNVEVNIIVEDIDGTETRIQPINEVDISKNPEGGEPEIYIGYFYQNEKEII